MIRQRSGVRIPHRLQPAVMEFVLHLYLAALRSLAANCNRK
jgi:hypothetical protein